jgi:hypothetical protein
MRLFSFEEKTAGMSQAKIGVLATLVPKPSKIDSIGVLVNTIADEALTTSHD